MATDNRALAGRVAVVTGAGKGLGRAWALHLASLGAAVVVNNRGRSGQPGGRSADAVVGDIRAAGGEAIDTGLATTSLLRNGCPHKSAAWLNANMNWGWRQSNWLKAMF